MEISAWIISFLIAVLGVLKAAYGGQYLFWLIVWPLPVALACTVFIFVRRDFISRMECWSLAESAMIGRVERLSALRNRSSRIRVERANPYRKRVKALGLKCNSLNRQVISVADAS